MISNRPLGRKYCKKLQKSTRFGSAFFWVTLAFTAGIFAGGKDAHAQCDDSHFPVVRIDGPVIQVPAAPTANTDYNGRPIKAALRCNPGELITRIGAKDLELQFDNDATDGFTISCATLEEDGTLSNTRPFLSNPDIDNSSRNLAIHSCPAGAVFAHLPQKDRPNGSENNDYLDGIIPGCQVISAGGLGVRLPVAPIGADLEFKALLFEKIVKALQIGQKVLSRFVKIRS